MHPHIPDIHANALKALLRASATSRSPTPGGGLALAKLADSSIQSDGTPVLTLLVRPKSGLAQAASDENRARNTDAVAGRRRLSSPNQQTSEPTRPSATTRRRAMLPFMSRPASAA